MHVVSDAFSFAGSLDSREVLIQTLSSVQKTEKKIYIYIFTWNPNDPNGQGPLFEGFKPQNRGQTCSRFVYLLRLPARSTFCIPLFAQSSTRILFVQIKRKTGKNKKEKNTKKKQRKQKTLWKLWLRHCPQFFLFFFGCSGIIFEKTVSITSLWYPLFPKENGSSRNISGNFFELLSLTTGLFQWKLPSFWEDRTVLKGSSF